MAVLIPTMSDYYSAPYGAYHGPGYHGSGPRDNLGYFSSGGWGPRGGVSKRGHRGGGSRSYQQGGGSGFQSLQQLKANNKRQARKHYKGSYGQTPRSVPPAPDNTSSFLLSGNQGPSPSPGLFHSATPSTFAPGTTWKNGYGGVDKEALERGAAAGIDLFGSIAGTLGDDADFESDHEDDQEPGTSKQQFEEQQAYITELEERNLTLQEKVYLLEEQLKDLQAQLRTTQGQPGRRDSDTHQDTASEDGSENEHIEHTVHNRPAEDAAS